MQENELVAPEYLSPSSINTFRQCPLKFKYSKLDGLVDPSGHEAILGNFVHDILEDLYKLPAEFRTQAEARAIAKEQWDKKWHAEIYRLIRSEKELTRFRWAAWWCVENLWKLENPLNVGFDGLEKYVRGKMGGVKIHGYIDRYSVANSVSTVGDYKTGKTPKKAYLEDKFFQLIIYSFLLSENNVLADSRMVELLYLKDGVKFEKSVSDSDIQEAAELIQTTKEQIDEKCRTGNFEAKKSILCNWCGFKSFCPAWQK